MLYNFTYFSGMGNRQRFCTYTSHLYLFSHIPKELEKKLGGLLNFDKIIIPCAEGWAKNQQKKKNVIQNANFPKGREIWMQPLHYWETGSAILGNGAKCKQNTA